MHAAPPVRMSLVPDRAWHGAVALCAAAAGANLAGWVALQVQSPDPIAFSTTLLAGIAAALTASWWLRRDATTGVLTWDGGVWQWAAGAAAPFAVEPRVMIDLGPWLLLRIAPTEPARRRVAWRVASRRCAGASWPQWRAALYARRTDDRHMPTTNPK